MFRLTQSVGRKAVVVDAYKGLFMGLSRLAGVVLLAIRNTFGISLIQKLFEHWSAVLCVVCVREICGIH